MVAGRASNMGARFVASSKCDIVAGSIDNVEESAVEAGGVARWTAADVSCSLVLTVTSEPLPGAYRNARAVAWCSQ